MPANKALWIAATALATLGGLNAFQNFNKPWREYPAFEYNDFPDPAGLPGEDGIRVRTSDVSECGERPRVRPPFRGRRLAAGRTRHLLDHGLSPLRPPPDARAAAVDAHPRRSVEQPVNLDDDDQYDWPWLYGVEVGHWELTDQQAQRLREYLLRGGFLMVDDFHGTYEWQIFTESMKRVFPDREIVDLRDSEQIFHVIYDLDGRYQVPARARGIAA